MRANVFIALVGSLLLIGHPALAFEGRITATLTRGNHITPLLYTAGTNFLRVEITATNRPNAVNILDLSSGEMTLLFPNNHSFVKFQPSVENNSAPRLRFPETSNPPAPPTIGSTNFSGMPTLPGRPMGKMELTTLDDTTNLLGYDCGHYQIKQRGETMDIWATTQLFPFQPYLPSQPHGFTPQMIERQWGDLLRAKKIFPLLAILKLNNGTERLRFQVQSVTPQKLTDDATQLFQPPAGWFENQPLPF